MRSRVRQTVLEDIQVVKPTLLIGVPQACTLAWPCMHTPRALARKYAQACMRTRTCTDDGYRVRPSVSVRVCESPRARVRLVGLRVRACGASVRALACVHL